MVNLYSDEKILCDFSQCDCSVKISSRIHNKQNSFLNKKWAICWKSSHICIFLSYTNSWARWVLSYFFLSFPSVFSSSALANNPLFLCLFHLYSLFCVFIVSFYISSDSLFFLLFIPPSICLSSSLCLSLSPSLRVWLACVVYVPSRCSVDLCCHLPDYLPDSLSLFSNVQSIIIN